MFYQYTKFQLIEKNVTNLLSISKITTTFVLNKFILTIDIQMKANELRQAFLDFFGSKEHKIVPSAPMVIKNDPSLMFTNAGMNPFKDIFLGNAEATDSRLADSQKCLRVSGKHNDLEEVGHDTYHHTMFEMLGNWSFGDYFKTEAINWAWEFLTEILQIDKNRLYATVFEGDKKDKTNPDEEARNLWSKHLPKERILYGNKKDNFWEMGDAGPCGPCSEIHIDLRPDNERTKVNGSQLVNKDHPLVIEIWNLVFIQYNRKQNKSLESLPHKHIDTGMGFERLAMAVQHKTSNYDTDIFQPIIQEIARLSDKFYGEDGQRDIAMRVIADHVRAVSFAIADGQVPSNNKAGYVIRRILRRAVRYAYTFLDRKEPFMYLLLPVLIEQMGDAYPELKKEATIIRSVIFEEESAFLRTLSNGISILEGIIKNCKKQKYKVINGEDAFKLYDSYGFPLDLTELIARENNLIVSRREFDEAMAKQRASSKADAAQETGDWIQVSDNWDEQEQFIGYDHTEATVSIIKYREVKLKGKKVFHLVYNLTPFYAESGGQVGDTGYIENNGDKVSIFDTQKEHNLILHYADKLPKNLNLKFKATVASRKRQLTSCNHSATHLLDHALRKILGSHIEQKGSLVDSTHLRFDFPHFQKLSAEDIRKIEEFVNSKIRQNIALQEHRDVPIDEAKKMGAIALFGEKYGDVVRIIQFADSIEFCGGTHVKSTGEIGFFKITKESAIAAGIRRIEAITSVEAEKYIFQKLDLFSEIEEKLKNPTNIVQGIEKLLEENTTFQKEINEFRKRQKSVLKEVLKKSIRLENGYNILSAQPDGLSASDVKDIAFQLKKEVENLILIVGIEAKGKANLSIMISETIVKKEDLHAGKIVKEAAKEIQGGGGGQPFFATAGGKNPAGIAKAIAKAEELIKKELNNNGKW